MEKNLKVLLDVEIVDDEMNTELQTGFGRLTYSYQACGGGGGGCGACGSCGACGGGSRYTAEEK